MGHSGSPQRGAVLLVSLVFLLLLTLLGVSSMQNATLQEKMAGSVTMRNISFQTAEAALRLGESSIQVTGFVMTKCNSVTKCAPPSESTSTTLAAGLNSNSGVTWVVVPNGFYGIQNLGTTTSPVNRPPNCSSASSVTLYRVTGVGNKGNSKTVLESIYANC
ncbi:PilX N-terminal domain-containing pilus assembly protein [Xanthomonas sp. WHRI 1810A]|uniref:pilus assembly PilX family protein n=1 Tax=Xanthomonas sp. WHRI 1810A TaxID=3161565 RepID=UPI0032E92458